MKQFPGAKAPAALLLALGAATAAGLLYPGDGGYSLTRHYFSDLGMTVTYDGESNLAGAVLFLGACGAFGYGVWGFARVLGSMTRERVGRWGFFGAGSDAAPRARFPIGGTDTCTDSDADGWVPGAATQGDNARADRAGDADEAPPETEADSRGVPEAPTHRTSGGARAPGGGQLPGYGQTSGGEDHPAGAQKGLLLRFGRTGVLIGGFLAAVFFLLTGFTPKNHLFHLHNWVSYSAFLALLMLWVSGALLVPPGSLRALHVTMVLLSAAYLAVLFARPSWNMPDGWALQVVAQKIVVTGNWLGAFLGSVFLRTMFVSRET